MSFNIWNDRYRLTNRLKSHSGKLCLRFRIDRAGERLIPIHGHFQGTSALRKKGSRNTTWFISAFEIYSRSLT
jgi:hypothetical protein